MKKVIHKYKPVLNLKLYKNLFYFSLPCSDISTDDVEWTNQELFNHVNFTLDTQYHPILTQYYGETYIERSGFGVVYSGMHLLHTKVDRNGNIRVINCK